MPRSSLFDSKGKKSFPNGFDLTLKEERINEPIKWKKPRRIFVNSMSDLFHADIPEKYLQEIWYVMAEVAVWHVYQILTKRPDEMQEKMERLNLKRPNHIWLGVSVENQEMADRRIPVLASIPGINRFLSCEPLLGPINIAKWLDQIHWVIDGGESGGGRRRPEYDWFREIRDACIAADIPYFHKQGDSHRPGKDRRLDGKLWEEYPETMDGLEPPPIKPRVKKGPSPNQMGMF